MSCFSADPFLPECKQMLFNLFIDVLFDTMALRQKFKMEPSSNIELCY